MLISEMDGQSAKQFLELGSAFLLSAVIGLEREIRHKSPAYALIRLSEQPPHFSC